MKFLLFTLLLTGSVSSFAIGQDENNLQGPAQSLKEYDGKWVMTDSFCNSGNRGDLTFWTSSYLEIKDGNIESRVSGPDCMTLEKIIYSEAGSQGDVSVYDEVGTIQLSKQCFSENNKLFKSDGDGVMAVKSKLYINNNKPTEIYQIMKDADCGGGKGLTAVYSRFQ